MVPLCTDGPTFAKFLYGCPGLISKRFPKPEVSCCPIDLCQTCFDSACVCDAVLEQVDVIYSRSKARPDVRHMDWDQFARALRMVAEKRYPDLVKNGYRAVGPGTAAGLLAVLRRHVLASKSESWITQVVNV